MPGQPASWGIYRKTADGKLVLSMTVHTKYAADAARRAGMVVKANKGFSK